MKKNIKLSAKEQSVLDESSLQQIDPFNIDFEEGGVKNCECQYSKYSKSAREEIGMNS